MLKGAIQKKSNQAFIKVVSVGLVLFLVLSILVTRLYSRLYTMFMAMLGKLEIICGCQNHLAFFNHPYIFTSLVIIGVVALAVLLFIVYRVIKLRRNTIKFVKNELKSKKQVHSLKLKMILKELSLSAKVIELNSDDVEVFCHGVLRPQICISSKLVEDFSSVEIKSILLHEKYHLISGDPSKLMIVRVMSRALFFIPGYKKAIEKYILISELAADDYANEKLNDKVPLAQALYRLISYKRDYMESQSAVSNFQTVTEDRIKGLSDGLGHVKLRIFSPALVFGLVLFFTLSFSLNAMALSQNQVMTHASEACAMVVVDDDSSCHMDEWTTKECVASEYVSAADICQMR